MDAINIKVETMNINELAQLFRSVGISTSEAKLGDAIEQGLYPFAICIHQKGRQFEIYKRQVLEYLSSRAMPAEDLS